MGKRGDSKRARRRDRGAAPTSQPERDRRDARAPHPAREGQLFAGVWVLVLFAFAGALAGEFVEFDDLKHIANNVHFQSGSPLAFVAFWEAPYFGLYIPVTYTLWSFAATLSHALTSRLDPVLFHGLNLVVHALNVVLVYRLLRRCVGVGAGLGSAAAVFGAAVFALHPTQVESVAWASELRGLVAVSLGLSAVLVALSMRDGDGRPAWRAAAIATLLFVLALLSKPTAVAFPLVLLALDRWAIGSSLRRAWPLPAVWLALSLGVVAATRSLQPDVDLEYVPSAVERILVALDALGFYAWKLALPFGLGLDYGRSPGAVLTDHLYLYTAPLAIGLGALVVVFGRTRPWLLCAAALVVAPLLPVLGFVPFEFQFYSTVADRYLYLAILGVALAAAHAFGVLAASPTRKRPAMIGALALLAVFAGASRLQTRTWHTNETLFEQALAVNPTSFAAHHGLASHYYWQKRYAEAAEHCRQALEVKPDYLPAQKGLADAVLAQGDREGAIRQYLAALEQHTGATGKRGELVAEVHADLGVALFQAGQADAAISHLRSALELRPDLQAARRNLGRLLLRRGDSSAAIEQFRLALAVDPHDQASQQELDRALSPH